MPSGFEISGPESFIFIAVFAVFALVIGIIGFAVIKGLSQWRSNNNSPVETFVARVVTKRTQVSGGGERSARTGYFATFEAPSGDRRELAVPATQFGLLAEGDVGQLTHQGTRFITFERTSIASQ